MFNMRRTHFGAWFVVANLSLESQPLMISVMLSLSGGIMESNMAKMGNRYQNTTLRMPARVYERAKSIVSRSESSFNEFVVEAIEEKLHRLSEEKIDAAFAQMAEDDEYQQSSAELAREFEKSDWDALRATETEQTPLHGGGPKPEIMTRSRRLQASRNDRPSKARSR